MRRTLIIGATGFLGAALRKELLAGGWEVFALQHHNPLEPQEHLHIVTGGMAAIRTKLIDHIKPDIIYHCARPSYPRLRRIGRQLAALEANYLNRKLLYQLGRSKQKPTLVFASGSLVYGNSSVPHTEDSPANPVSYARQYYRGELPLVSAAVSRRYPVKVLRFPWLLGNGSWFAWFYLRSINEYGALPLFGAGGNSMSLIDLGDAARLMIQYAGSGTPGGIYNIYSPALPTQQEFLALASEIFRVPVRPYSEVLPYKPEREIMQAFSSNIILGTRYPEVLNDYPFRDLRDSLEGIFSISS